jgi:hypothetical protein
VTTLLLLACFAPARRNTAVDVKQLLSHPITGPDLGEEEVRAFCAKRIPRMPAVLSREEWETHAKRIRREVLDKVVFRGEAARRWRTYKAKVEWLDTIPGGPGYRIRKLRYEAVPGLWIPALLYEPEKLSGKTPVALHVNGHEGIGKAIPYKQIRCINLAKRGILVLNLEWLGMGQLRPMSHYSMNQLDLCGSSGLAVFYLAMRRGLDILVGLPNADKSRVAVSGLSGGGWQTIFLSSLDERVTLANPVAGYSSFHTRVNVPRDLGDSEQTPNDLATIADYVHLTALRAPRPTLITFNDKDDCCFRPDTGMAPLVDGAKPIYRLYGQEGRLQTHVNFDPGTHNYERDNREAYYRFLKEHFYGGAAGFDAKEIPSDSEVKKPEELDVPLPTPNSSFHAQALTLLDGLRAKRGAAPPSPSNAWKQRQRAELRKVLNAPRYNGIAESMAEETAGDTKAVYFKLRLGGEWTVPCVELTRGNPSGTTILLGDEGRAALAEQADRLLNSGQRVLAIDPFFFGEGKMKFGAGFLYPLLMAATGERALGVQAAQIGAIVRWASKAGSVTLHTQGPRTSLIALCAEALEPHGNRLELHGCLTSLEEIVRNDWTVDRYPEMFCFGLLEKFDIDHLRAMASR